MKESCGSVGYFNRHSFDDWVFLVRTGIFSAMIANQVSEHNRDGKGGITEEDMKRFEEEAGAVAEIWEKMTWTEVNKRYEENKAKRTPT